MRDKGQFFSFQNNILKGHEVVGLCTILVTYNRVKLFRKTPEDKQLAGTALLRAELGAGRGSVAKSTG